VLKSSLAEAASLPLAHEAKADWMGLRRPGMGEVKAKMLKG
jgi:hypothetical protein